MKNNSLIICGIPFILILLGIMSFNNEKKCSITYNGFFNVKYNKINSHYNLKNENFVGVYYLTDESKKEILKNHQNLNPDNITLTLYSNPNLEYHKAAKFPHTDAKSGLYIIKNLPNEYEIMNYLYDGDFLQFGMWTVSNSEYSADSNRCLNKYDNRFGYFTVRYSDSENPVIYKGKRLDGQCGLIFERKRIAIDSVDLIPFAHSDDSLTLKELNEKFIDLNRKSTNAQH